MPTPRVVGSSILLFFWGTGCGARSYAPLEEKVESMQAVREALTEANAHIDKVLGSLDKVVAWADRDPRPAMDGFEDDLGRLDELAAEARERAKAWQSASEKYFQSWQAENAGMKTAELQQLSSERMATARDTWNEVQEDATAVSEALQGFLDRIHEIKGYLANNLNPSGIEKGKPFIERARWSGWNVSEKISGLTAALNRMSADLAPAPTG